jgi:hypothetical protein
MKHQHPVIHLRRVTSERNRILSCTAAKIFKVFGQNTCYDLRDSAVVIIDVPHVSTLSLGGGCGNFALNTATLFDYSGVLSMETRRHVQK